MGGQNLKEGQAKHIDDQLTRKKLHLEIKSTCLNDCNWNFKGQSIKI